MVSLLPLLLFVGGYTKNGSNLENVQRSELHIGYLKTGWFFVSIVTVTGPCIQTAWAMGSGLEDVEV